MSVAPFDWDALPVASREVAAVATWLDAIGWPRQGVLGGVSWRRAARASTEEVRQRLAEPTLARVRVRRGGAIAVVALPARLWRALAEAIVGDDGPAWPRPPGVAERAFAAAAVADALVGAGIDGDVELGDDPWRGDALVVELAVATPVAAEVVVVMPARPPPPPPRSLAALVAERGGRLPAVRARLALARGRLARWGDAVVGDVVVVGPSVPALLVGAGAIAVALDAGRSAVTVLSPYERTPMPAEELAHDLSVPLAIVAGDVTVSARDLLELAPGQVLALGRAPGGTVELRAGDRCVARGELVTVDGELGVRVTELVGAAPPVVATRG